MYKYTMCKNTMYKYTRWPTSLDYEMLAARHMGQKDHVNAAKRDDQSRHSMIKKLVGTTRHVAPAAQLADAVSMRGVVHDSSKQRCTGHASASLTGCIQADEVQGCSKASHQRSVLNQDKRPSLCCRVGGGRCEDYRNAMYFKRGDEVLIDLERQEHYLDREQPSPFAAWCHLHVSSCSLGSWVLPGLRA